MCAFTCKPAPAHHLTQSQINTCKHVKNVQIYLHMKIKMHRHYTHVYKYMTTSSTNSAERSHVLTYHLILSHCEALHFKCLACTCAMAMTPGPSDPSKQIESNSFTTADQYFQASVLGLQRQYCKLPTMPSTQL